MMSEGAAKVPDPLFASISSSSLDSFSTELTKKAYKTSTDEGEPQPTLSTQIRLCPTQSVRSMSQTEMQSSQTLPDVIPSVSSDSHVTRVITAVSPMMSATKYVMSNSSTSATSSITAALHPSGLPLYFNPPLSTSVSQAVIKSHFTDGRLSYVSAASNTVPEFLYQLTKMLTDDNREIIEWAKGKIEVHSPHKLESEVLKKYFRHSKFASFQRQLNYFGFRKLAGKGKMAPCSYVNEAAGEDVHSLLHIKRKSNIVPPEQEHPNKKTKSDVSTVGSSKVHLSPISDAANVNPVLAGIFKRSRDSMVRLAPAKDHQTQLKSAPGTDAHDLAQTAVGRGIRHSFAANTATIGIAIDNGVAHTVNASMDQEQHQMQPSESTSTRAANIDSLSQLASNFRNSLMQSGDSNEFMVDAEPTPLSEMYRSEPIPSSETNYFYNGFLSRNSSLVDLAMIAPVDESKSPQPLENEDNFDFVDFPGMDMFPVRSSSDS